MVGFPGESDEDFNATCRLIEGSPLTYLHVFPFSSRPGTAAAELPYAVPDHVSKHRGRALRQLIAQKNEAFRRSMIGRDVEVLVLDEEPENGARPAVSNNFLRVAVPLTAPINEWLQVRIEDLHDDGLIARLSL
jgi:threonylcarbamoyladenosine tRNA methylthiotransferase MtaB